MPSTPGTPTTALWALALVLVLRLVFHLFHKGGDYLWCGLAVGIMRQIGADAFARVQRYSAEWHASTFAGATVRKITRGIWGFDDLGDALYYHLLPSVAVVVGVIVLMATRWPMMGAMFFAGAALYTVVSAYLTVAYVSPRRRAAIKTDSKLGGAIADAITCNAVVKTTSAEPREDRRLADMLEAWRATMQRAWRAGIDTSVVQAATMLLLQLVLLGTALWLWHEGRATPGDVAFVLTSFMLVNGYLRDVGMYIRMAQQAVNDIEDVVEYALTPPAITDRADARALAVDAGEIHFEKVRFGYQGQGGLVFDGLEVALRPGEKVALVGHSGSGKTTFVKLLPAAVTT